MQALRGFVRRNWFSLVVLAPIALALARRNGYLLSAPLEDYRGQLVLLSFWATWCPPCRAEMPSMQGRRVVAPFVEERKLTFPVLLDPRGRGQAAYGVGSIPTSFLVDRRGRIVSREVGAIDWSSAAARSVVERLLAEAVAAEGA